MRTLLIAVLLFAAIHMLRIDLTEGTISRAFFADPDMPCEENQVRIIRVTAFEGDTVETLFAVYPDPALSLIERLSLFYSLNPHLQNQQLKHGLEVKLPLTDPSANACGD